MHFRSGAATKISAPLSQRLLCRLNVRHQLLELESWHGGQPARHNENQQHCWFDEVKLAEASCMRAVRTLLVWYHTNRRALAAYPLAAKWAEMASATTYTLRADTVRAEPPRAYLLTLQSEGPQRSRDGEPPTPSGAALPGTLCQGQSNWCFGEVNRNTASSPGGELRLQLLDQLWQQKRGTSCWP